MKNYFLIFLISLASFSAVAQKKKATEKVKDTVKTEIVEVVTTYNPEIADANKIKKNPIIKLLDNSKKKKLNYTIFSAPVASTFVPKSGVVKGIDVGVRERLYDNYIAAGFGNYTSPYLEAYLHNYTRFQSEFGFSTLYNASLENIKNTDLDSDYSSLLVSLFYKQEERYFDWKVTLNTERKDYNWYGLQPNTFMASVVDNIDENQTYNYFNAIGELDFLDSYLDKGSISFGYFTDAFKSQEFLMNLNADFDVPLNMINSRLNNLKLGTSLEYLKGNFKNEYAHLSKIDYAIFTAAINPEYTINSNGFLVKLGTKIVASFDTENSINNFLIYPDVKIQKEVIKEQLNIYAGVFGDFHTNTYQNFTDENPFISPTQIITQTAEKYNAFLGINGMFNNDFSFNISASLKEEQDKALFVQNNSKSNGLANHANGIPLKGYEYGNSFSVVYDDVKTTAIFAEAAYELNKNITLATNIQFHNYSLQTQLEAWNLPEIEASFTAKYKSNTWYATSNIFHVGERKAVLYTVAYPSESKSPQTLKSFVDVNINGGYHFNDAFSVFVKANNILNANYQRFTNFNVQGFQILGGVTYKFDF